MAMGSQGEPGARGNQWQAGGARRSQEEPGGASQGELAKGNRGEPGRTRRSQEEVNYSIPPGSSWLLIGHCSSWFSPGLVACDEFLGGPRRTHGDPRKTQEEGRG